MKLIPMEEAKRLVDLEIAGYEGEERATYAIARKMFAGGVPVEKISEYTGLSEGEITNLVSGTRERISEDLVRAYQTKLRELGDYYW